jgi:phosphoribosylglycinamide formyltransferase-1
MSKRIVVLISGQGRNLQALIRHCGTGAIPAQIAAAISNQPSAPGLEHARAAGIPALTVAHGGFATRAGFDDALADAIAPYQPDIVVLAGFMRVLGGSFIRRFGDRMLNIHPSLLPKYQGLRTHQRALEAGDVEHGATVHYVTEQLDGGPSVIQGRLRIRPDDDVETLAARVMNEIELKIYPQAVAWMARGELRLDHGRVRFRERLLETPFDLDSVEAEFR